MHALWATLLYKARLITPSIFFPIKSTLISKRLNACLPVVDSLLETQTQSVHEETFEKLSADVIYTQSKIFIQASLW